MTYRPNEEIQARWAAIDKELQGIAEGKVVDGCPAEREAQLLGELDELEYEAGLIIYPRFHSPKKPHGSR